MQNHLNNSCSIFSKQGVSLDITYLEGNLVEVKCHNCPAWGRIATIDTRRLTGMELAGAFYNLVKLWVRYKSRNDEEKQRC